MSTSHQPHTSDSTNSTHSPHSKKLKPKYKVLALTGPQGSGKTTQLKLILDKIDAEYASVGDILRSILPFSEKPEHKEALQMMYSGVLIPDELTFEILKDYFSKKQQSGDTKEVLIFDGFPRTSLQTQHLYELSRVYHGMEEAPIAIVRMKLEHADAMKRCLDRAEGLIKVGKEARVDDTPEAIAQRLGIYFNSIPHLNAAFEGKAHLHEFDGAKQIHEVHSDVLERLFE
ncbi:MAG: nucleoside monophosphate kinase [Candidatus Pacebacteria bacterium]|nr:nucleoside monophosphate kinase [Candidatus Paceibacterota bacterium]